MQLLKEGNKKQPKNSEDIRTLSTYRDWGNPFLLRSALTRSPTCL